MRVRLKLVRGAASPSGRRRRAEKRKRKRKGKHGVEKGWEIILPALPAAVVRAVGGCEIAGSAWKRPIGDVGSSLMGVEQKIIAQLK